MLLSWTLLLATACTGSGPGPGPVSTEEAEEVRSKAERPGIPPGCTDADGDGFADAWTCPGLPPDLADCADQDPAVGPDTERFVPAGPFRMGGRPGEAGRDELPMHEVQLSAYCLDRFELAAGPYAAWLAAQGRVPAGPDATNPDAAGRVVDPQRPAEGLSRQEAADWCASRGQQLPTEAQWEKAARGGCEGGSDPARCDAQDERAYPWGQQAPTCARANHRVTGPRGPQPCAEGSLPVAALPEGEGPYGHRNLAGNVWEWTADRYHPAVYGLRPRTDPTGPESGEVFTMRGGSWSTFSTNMRLSNRMSDQVMGSAVGVRCARSFSTGQPDPTPALAWVALSGRVDREDGAPLVGRALYVTAFDLADLDPRTGRLRPGASPVAERRFHPASARSQDFELPVPAGGLYRLSAALDAGNGQGPAPSGSGGMGELAEPVRAEGPVGGLVLHLRPAPSPGPPP